MQSSTKKKSTITNAYINRRMKAKEMMKRHTHRNNYLEEELRTDYKGFQEEYNRSGLMSYPNTPLG